MARDAPHRPSRRGLIITAAIAVFARKGFSDASIQEIAEEAHMLPTAVYYHFSGKEELFECALRGAMDASDAVMNAPRADAFALWDWMEQHPHEAQLLFLHLPGVATPGTRALRSDYEERYVRRTYDLSSSRPSRRAVAAQHAARTLAVRTMIGLNTSIHPLRREGGPLTTLSRERMQQAVADVSARIITEA